MLSLKQHFDVFVFDAFGVLNVGETAIIGASECISQLKADNKQVFVLTNGASASLAAMPQKYSTLGFDFAPEEVVSSRLAAELAMQRISEEAGGNLLWGVITGGRSSPEDLPVNAVTLDDNQADYDRVDAIAMLSSLTWNDARQKRLRTSLQSRPRPLVVGNPDVVAPHESGFSLEPGFFAHQLIDEINVSVEFHGKPFQSVFELVRQRIDEKMKFVVPDKRIAMLGDTLHTDVLGAKAAGWSSILVSDHGLFRGCNVDDYINESGIVPDWIIPSI
ncbi:MAG: HAD hydrolase-like protein [Granulosicoccus sp.]|nr:HAD hydrolase-like protein [Granulosicoccus sp.]